MPKTVCLVGVDAPLPYPCGLCSSIALMTSYDSLMCMQYVMLGRSDNRDVDSLDVVT